MACRLIPLDKNPSVRPIGFGEVLRRIIGNTIMYVLKKDVREISGNLKLCVGHRSECEIAVYAAVDLFNDDNNHGILQIDANNAFNYINRQVVIHKMKILRYVPEFAVYIRNCYTKPVIQFVTGCKELSSNEGTTQGDPKSDGNVAIGILPKGLLSLMILQGLVHWNI